MSWIKEALDAYAALGDTERAAVDAAAARVVRVCEMRRDLMWQRAREAETSGDDRDREVFDQRAIEANVLVIDVAVATGVQDAGYRNIEAREAVRREAEAAVCRTYERGDPVWVYDRRARAKRPNGEPVGGTEPGWVAGRFEFRVTNGEPLGDISVYRDDGGGRLVVRPWCVAPRAEAPRARRDAELLRELGPLPLASEVLSGETPYMRGLADARAALVTMLTERAAGERGEAARIRRESANGPVAARHEYAAHVLEMLLTELRHG